MKLSELDTNKALDVICEITPYVTDIASDDHLLKEIRRTFDDGKEKHDLADMIKLGVSKTNKIVPILLKEKREALYGIVGVLNNKTLEEIGEQKGYKTAWEIYQLLNDKELIDFFKSCASMEGNE